MVKQVIIAGSASAPEDDDSPDTPIQTINLSAARKVVDALEESGVLQEVDAAVIAGFLSLALTLDVQGPNAKADLWREYRAYNSMLREIANGGTDDDTAEYLDEIAIYVKPTRGRAKVGDTKKS